jgi:hypothetical protein
MKSTSDPCEFTPQRLQRNTKNLIRVIRGTQVEDLSTSFVLACYVPVLLPLSVVSADPRACGERWAVHIILSVLMYYLNS